MVSDWRVPFLTYFFANDDHHVRLRPLNTSLQHESSLLFNSMSGIRGHRDGSYTLDLNKIDGRLLARLPE